MLENFEILENLTETQIKSLEAICDFRSFQQGETIFREGDTTDELFFLMTGQIDLYKLEPETKNNVKFKEMTAGKSFGEMSFFDDSPRSCAIKSGAPNTSVLVLSKQKLFDTLSDGGDIVNEITKKITHQVNDLLRGLSNKHIGVLQRQIDELKERNRFAHFLFSLFLCLLLVTLFNAFIRDASIEYNVYSLQFLAGYAIIAILLPTLLALNKLELSFREIGVTKKNLKKSLLDGFVVSLGGLAIAWAIAATVDFFAPAQDLTSQIFQPLYAIPALIYILHGYIQEFVRAAVQISIQRFSSGWKSIYPIVMTALIFGMVHSPYGTKPIIFALLGSIIFGFVYQRTHNLIGVSLVHFVFGCLAINMGLI